MEKSHMVCAGCIKFHETECRLSPLPQPVASPETHWCSHGEWSVWSQRFREMEIYRWGDWETPSPDRNP
jgi:hypothetical protein